MKLRLTAIAFLFCWCVGFGGESLEGMFESPPTACRPWCYWYWVNGNVDEKTVSSDIEAMKRVGFGGLLLLDPRGYDKIVRKPSPKMPFGGAEWRKMVVFAMRECRRLGIEFTMNLSDCGGSLKGPWPTGEDGPKRLVCGVDVVDVPQEYRGYHDIAVMDVFVAEGTMVESGWRQVGDETSKYGQREKGRSVATVSPDSPMARKVSLRFGYCLIPNREHDVDVIDADAVERHWHRITDDLFAEAGDLVGSTWTHVYSVSWEGAIPTWTGDFENQFRKYAGYDLRSQLPVLAGFTPPRAAGGDAGSRADTVVNDFRRVRNLMFKDCFYGKVRDLAHERGLKLYSESGGPWNRAPDVFREADQLAFLGMNDMPQGEFWTMRPSHHSALEHSRPAGNAAHIYGLRRASAEAFVHMDLHYSMYPSKLKRSADCAFADGVNHLVWHTFTCSPTEFGHPGIEYFAGTHINPNVTWFNEAEAFVSYLARCQTLLQAGTPVTDIALYGGASPYRHWGRYRHLPWDGARIAIPRGYCYDVLNDETLHRKRDYPVFLDGTADVIVWPRLPPPDLEGPFDDFVHRRLEDGTDIYFVISESKGRGDAIFRVKDKVAEFWDPIDGSRWIAAGAEPTPDGRTRIRLRFTNDGSMFVVFRPKENVVRTNPASDAKLDALRLPQNAAPLAELDRGWEIDIGGRAYGRLGDWTKSEDPAVRYFSGRAFYRTSFDLDDVPDGDCMLYLGRVAGGCARVVVNGVDCGVAWCYPYRVKIPSALLRHEKNSLEVQVVNTWRNRLIGDCLQPERERVAATFLDCKAKPHNDAFSDGGFAPRANGYCVNDTLESCGLFGPVKLFSVQ